MGEKNKNQLKFENGQTLRNTECSIRKINHPVYRYLIYYYVGVYYRLGNVTAAQLEYDDLPQRLYYIIYIRLVGFRPLFLTTQTVVVLRG